MASDDDSSLPLIEGEKFEVPNRLFARGKTACLRFLRTVLHWIRSRNHGETRQLKKTAYLDGLRGFSALLVYLHHHTIWAHSASYGMAVLENAFGWEGHHVFACLPILRNFFTGGNSAVAVFFLISGYVLSVSPLHALHSSEPSRIGDYLGSAFFRRWVRLFLPVLATTFVWMTTWHVFDIKSNNSISKQPESSYSQEIWVFYRDFKAYSFIFNEGYWNGYNDHLWSIPLEFRGSVFVWTVLLAISRFAPGVRLILEAGLTFYLIFIVDGWYCACFIIGLMLCEMDMLVEKDCAPPLLTRLTPKRSWIYWIFLIVALYLAGVPSILHSQDPVKDLEGLRNNSPGWYYLSFLVPEPFSDYRWFYRIIAGTLLMISIPRITILKNLMESRFCQFLGKHSYALYLVHGPILWSVGDRIYAAVGRTHDKQHENIPAWVNLVPLSGKGPFGLEINYILAQLILLPLTLWVASLVTKTVDEPSVNFARRMFDICNKSSTRTGS
jgi:peptidoglycan/LPS O-acetylase OafA/YrhL